MLLKYVLRGVSSEFRRLAFRSLFYIIFQMYFICTHVILHSIFELWSSNVAARLFSYPDPCLRRYDSNGNGDLDLHEFLMMLCP